MPSVMAEADLTAPTCGVVHIRSRHTENFTVLANRLAQRRGSAVTVGIATYILSVADGTLITIDALCDHFDEGEILVARALRELEAEGWLERRVGRDVRGRVVTRTFVYDMPGVVGLGSVSAPVSVPAPAPVPVSAPVPMAVPEAVQVREPGAVQPRELLSVPAAPAVAAAPAVPVRAVGSVVGAEEIIMGLPRIAPELRLTRWNVAQLTPAVSGWLAAGAHPDDVTDALTRDLPAKILSVSALLAHRLKAAPPPARQAVVPMRECPDCRTAFKAVEPGRCGDCRRAGAMAVAG